jgi:hypothetical protein
VRKQWLTGLGVVSLVGCVVSSTGNNKSGTTDGTPVASEPGPAAAPMKPGGITVAEINRALDLGHTFDQTMLRVAGDADIADFRVQTRIRMANAAKTSKAPYVDWNIQANAPVRASPATYGKAFGTASPADLLAFAIDTNTTNSAAGLVTTSLANGCTNAGGNCSAATQFFISNLYTASLPQVVGWGASNANLFELGAMMFSFNPAAIEVYSLAFGKGNVFCFQIPAGTGPGGSYTNTTNNLAVKCNGWNNVAPVSVGGNAITWSAPFPAYDSVGNITNFYYGDDAGKLQCVTDNSETTPPQPCAGYGSSGSAGQKLATGAAKKLGPPTVFRVDATHNIIYVGDEGGVFYRVVDHSGTLTISRSTLGAGNAFEIHGGPALDYSHNQAYVAAGGAIYTFDTTSSVSTWQPKFVTPVTLFGSPTVPIDATPTLDAASVGGGNFLYLTTNNTMYRVAYPITNAETATSTPLFNQVGSNFTVDAQTIAAGSEPLGYAFPWQGATYIGSGTGASTSGRLEQYNANCATVAGAPILTSTSNGGPYGKLVETGLIIDNGAHDLYFGYDNGPGNPVNGGIVAYPLPSTTASAWSCPTGTVSTAGAACAGHPGCVSSSSSCVTSANCLNPALPVCNTTSHTCVQCLAKSDCSSTPTTPECNTSAVLGTVDTCVQCLTGADCSSPTAQCQSMVNDSHVFSCVACTADVQCTGGYCEERTADPEELSLDYTCVACGPSGTQLNESTDGCGGSNEICNEDTGGFFDQCIATTQATGTACTVDSNCASVTNGTGTALTHCDSVMTSPMDQFCVQCDAANPACAAGSCDLIEGDPTFDQCVTCTPTNDTDNAACSTASPNEPVCDASKKACVQCPTVAGTETQTAADAFCPGTAAGGGNPLNHLHCGLSATNLCDCDTNADCPTGGTSVCCTGAGVPVAGCVAGACSP